MTEDEVLELARALPGVTVTTAGPDDVGTPESAWGDSFVFYDPDDRPADRLWPFATVVCSDYPGFDTVSRLDRPGVYRVNLAVGRRAFAELVGYPPAAHPEHDGEHDHAALDVLLPHPVYAAQGWVSVLCPADREAGRLPDLLALAHRRAAERHRRG